MINEEEIKSFLEGNDPEEHIVAIEFDYAGDCIYKVKEIPGKGKEIRKDTFTSFAWVGDLRGLNFYQSSKAQQKEGMSKHGILIERLRTTDENGESNDRLENGLKYMVKSLKGYRSLIQFFRDGGVDPWGERTKDKNTLNVTYNRVGDRLSAVGFQGYADIFENSRNILDVVYLRKINKGEIKIAINDIFAQSSIYYQKTKGDLIKTNNEQTISLTINFNL